MDLLQVLGRQHDDRSANCETYSNPYSKMWVSTPKGIPQTAWGSRAFLTWTPSMLKILVSKDYWKFKSVILQDQSER